MKDVSIDFKTAISAPSRMCKMRVIFDISDVDAHNDVFNITTTSDFSLSNKQQTINKARDNTYKLATFEKDRWLLDGSFVIPSETITENKEIGWWSDVLCDDLNTFTPSQDIEIEFNGIHSSIGITVSFDITGNEYATDFDILVYDNIGNIINETNIINNTLARYELETPLSNYKKIIVKIYKWSHPQRRAKVTEIDFGIVKVYDDDKLIKASIEDEVDITNSRIPIGELKFTVDNSNKKFNILNPVGFYNFLQQRQQAIAEVGVDAGSHFEYCKMGTFYLNEWKSDEDSLTATFTARNILDFLDSYMYENLSARSITLYTLATEIFSLCGISDYWIDSELNSISTTGLVRKTTCRNVLKMIAIASRSNVYVIDKQIIIKHYDIDLNTDLSVGNITMDNMYKSPQIKLDDLIQQADVYYYIDINTRILKTSLNPEGINGKVLKLENNTLISSEAVAQSVGEWIIANRSFRAIYNVNWRQNPAIDLLDILNTDNTYQNKKSIVTKQKIDYAGYLSGKTELRGDIGGTS